MHSIKWKQKNKKPHSIILPYLLWRLFAEQRFTVAVWETGKQAVLSTDLCTFAFTHLVDVFIQNDFKTGYCWANEDYGPCSRTQQQQLWRWWDLNEQLSDCLPKATNAIYVINELTLLHQTFLLNEMICMNQCIKCLYVGQFKALFQLCHFDIKVLWI